MNPVLSNLFSPEVTRQIDFLLNELIVRHRMQPADSDDLRQEMLFALFIQSEDYDPEKGSVATYIRMILQRMATRCMSNRCHHYQRKMTPIDELQENEQPLCNETWLGDLSEIDRLYLKNDVDGFQQKMTDRQKTICRLLIRQTAVSRIARHLKVELKLIHCDLHDIREIFLDGGYFDTWNCTTPRKRAEASNKNIFTK